MKVNIPSTFTAKALAAFAVFMSFFYVFGGAYLLITGIKGVSWQWGLVGGLLLLYGSFRAYRTFQKYRNGQS